MSSGLTQDAVPSEEAKPRSAPDHPDRRAPGRPRSARADEAIIEAVLDLLSEGVGLEALSIEAVASRAGVGKATIYRRWPNKETLVVDAVAALKGPPAKIKGGSVREDLLTLLRPIGDAQQSRIGRIFPCLIPEVKRNPHLARYYHRITAPRRAQMLAVLRRGIDSGELRGDLDLEYVCAALAGPMVSHHVLSQDPDLDPDKLAETVVDLVLAAMKA